MRALIVVDVQNDFVSGSLAVPGAEEILEPIHALVTDGGHDYVIASRDWHPHNHCSFSLDPEFRDGSWPHHCVQGTRGAAFAWDALKAATIVVNKGMDRSVEAYSAFDGVTGAHHKLLAFLHTSAVTDVDVCGLALDYCVKETALDSAELDFNTRVLLPLTRPVTPDGGKGAVIDLLARHVRVVENTAEL